MYERRFTLSFALVAAFLSLLPSIYALLVSLPGSHYLGYQYNTDDHMVYAAWMRQAMDWHFLFDNRFAVDSQPGLTVNIYFFALGLIAKVLSIPVTTALARAGFSALFVFLVARVIRIVSGDVYTTKLGITLTTLGAGIGYLVWHNFGQTIVRPEAQIFSRVMVGRLPTDVWEPEGYVLPSMLTNSLFMVSLCLITVVLLAFLESRKSWRPVPGGFFALAALMNIHSYDVLMITLVMAAFLAAMAVRRGVTLAWIGRGLVMGSGAILPALWFLHVYELDPVFQKRAATLTYAPNFTQIVFGYLPMIGLGFVAMLKWRSSSTGYASRKRIAGTILLGALVLGMFLAAGGWLNGGQAATTDAYWMSWSTWGLVMLVGVVAICLLAEDEPAWNLLVAWAVVGLLAPYFPALFQRKLALGLAVPWAILAALGLGAIVAKKDRGSRNLATILGIVALCGTSMLWVIREMRFIKNNVANTTVHPVFLSSDAQSIVNYLQPYSNQHVVVVAEPGVPEPDTDDQGNPRIDAYKTPYIPDLNPIVSGLDGVYTYAGHWSETPDYDRRRSQTTHFFSAKATPEYRAQFLALVKPAFIIAPVPSTYDRVPLADLTGYGEVVFKGTQFDLIKVR